MPKSEAEKPVFQNGHGKNKQTKKTGRSDKVGKGELPDCEVPSYC